MKLSTARVGMLALAVTVGLSIAPGAWAGFAIVNLSPSKFISNCQAHGGTTSPAPTGGIRCTLPSGQTVDCSFDTNNGTAACEWPLDLPPKSAKALMGDIPPDKLAPTTSKPPKATGAPSTVQ